jgi:threonine synthase
MKKVKVFAPGSIGNVGSGFDVFGFALEVLGDTLEVIENDNGNLNILKIEGDSGISADPDRNIVTVGAKALLKEVGSDQGYDFTIKKGVLAGSGLGSSGSSATAGVFAINELLGRPYIREELLPFAAIGEKVASFIPHYDNVAPSMLGGFTVVRSDDPLEILQVEIPENLHFALVKPNVMIKTKEAKKMLGETMLISNAVHQFGNIAGLIIGMQRNDISLIGRSVEDKLAEPVRSKLIPNYSIAKEAALNAGATGFNISGSGPAMFAVCDGKEVAEKVTEALREANNQNNKVSLAEAVRKGLPDDSGLFMPETIPQLSQDFFRNLSYYSLAEIGYNILYPFAEESIPDVLLKEICDDAFSFDVPLVEVKEYLYSLELYHGPTLAFKDFGARFMARVLGHFNSGEMTRNTILVATSGDTGGAVANGFYKVDNVDVVILYPQGKVSDLQEKQMKILGHNIQAIAVEGNFDDCQRLVKKAFLDKSLTERFGLTSANSINIARLLPQMLYYFYAYGQLSEKGKPIVFSVPSGNYGNLTAGTIAKKMGLPVHHFIAATNANDIVPHYLETGEFEPKSSIETISNAMDVGDPSNFLRLQELFNKSLSEFRLELSGYSYSDEQIRETILNLYSEAEYILDPHGAIGFRALEDYMKDEDEVIGIFLETAHPIKFRRAIEPLIDKELELPEQLLSVMQADKTSNSCSADYDDFKSLLVNVL